MIQRRQLCIWVGRVVFAALVIGVTFYLFRVGLEKADKIGSGGGLIIALLALGVPYLLPTNRSPQPSGAGPTVRVEGTGAARAESGSTAVTGFLGAGGQLPDGSITVSSTGDAAAAGGSVSVSGAVNGNITIIADRAGITGQVLVVALFLLAVVQRMSARQDLRDLLGSGIAVAILTPIVIVASRFGGQSATVAVRRMSLITAFVALALEIALLFVLGGLPDPGDEAGRESRDKGSVGAPASAPPGGVTTTPGVSFSSGGGGSRPSPDRTGGGRTTPEPSYEIKSEGTPTPTLTAGELRNSGTLAMTSGQAANLDSSEPGDWKVGPNDRDWKSVGYNASYDGTTVGFDGSSGSFALMGWEGGWTYSSCRQAPYGNGAATGAAIKPGHGICYLTTKGHQALLVVRTQSPEAITFEAQVWQ